MEWDEGAAQKRLLQKIKENEELFTLIRATELFEEMEEKIPWAPSGGGGAPLFLVPLQKCSPGTGHPLSPFPPTIPVFTLMNLFLT